MKFKQLQIEEWQQFQNINFEFHDRLTILTGANGSGKTTILKKILSGWDIKSFNTPIIDTNTGENFYNGRINKTREILTSNTIGYLKYSNGKKSSVDLSGLRALNFQIDILNKEHVNCIFIPENRSVLRYEKLSNVSLDKKSRHTAFGESVRAKKEQYKTGSDGSPGLIMKKNLVNWSMRGAEYSIHGRKKIPADLEALNNFLGFEEILKKILPIELGFESYEIRNNDIVFVCNGGKDDFLFEEASGGISALIEMSWIIYNFSMDMDEFTVIIDEVENHLHPIMQRQILPDLLEAFPSASFIVSTHSPLVVSSVKDSNIYALIYDENKKIISQKLDMVNQAKTASEILDEVLGVSFTMPIWAEESLNEIISKYSKTNMTSQEFSNMRNELKEAGLEKLVPEAIYNLIEKENEKN